CAGKGTRRVGQAVRPRPGGFSPLAPVTALHLTALGGSGTARRQLQQLIRWQVLCPPLPLANALAPGAVGSILVSSAAGSLASYVVTRAETRKCADFWIYLETGKSPQELAVASRVSQPAGMFPSLPAAFPGLVMPVSSLL
uniref:TM141 protein n=1 Tax=Buteo japonicus TaxID=224669 RepID=A0A8B9YYT4_9AVES